MTQHKHIDGSPDMRKLQYILRFKVIWQQIYAEEVTNRKQFLFSCSPSENLSSKLT